MGRIGIVVSYPEFYYLVKSIVGESKDIVVEAGSFDDALIKARELIENGAEVLISRGRLTDALRREFKSVTVVNIEISSYDMAEAIIRAKEYSRDIAIMLFKNTFYEDIDYSTLFNCNIGVYPIESIEQVKTRIQEVLKDGYKVVVGGKILCMAAKELGVYSVFVIPGRKEINSAIRYARSIIQFRDETIIGLNSINDVNKDIPLGIIAINKKDIIRTANKAAFRLLNKSYDQVIGNNLYNLFPKEIIAEGKGRVLNFDGEELVINKKSLYIEHLGISSVITIEKVSDIEREKMRIQNVYIRKGHRAKYNFIDIKGNSKAIKDTISIAKKYASVDSTILIEGETGTGKEVFAQSIHNSSTRKYGPFVAVNCAALTESLLESELFGYVGGSFTGAAKGGKVGLFEMANGGTIFLDEIGEISLTTQAKLLRVIQEREIVRIGDDRVIPIDVRVIAATNRNLQKLIEKGKFRSDLYYRICVLKLIIPPIRDRENDIKELLENFLNYYALTLGRKKPVIPNECYNILLRYKWPGNVRELVNFAERLVTAFDDKIISPHTIFKILGVKEVMPVESLDINNILKVLELNRFNKTKTARDLGVSRTTLWKLLKDNNIII